MVKRALRKFMNSRNGPIMKSIGARAGAHIGHPLGSVADAAVVNCQARALPPVASCVPLILRPILYLPFPVPTRHSKSDLSLATYSMSDAAVRRPSSVVRRPVHVVLRPLRQLGVLLG